MDIRCPQCETLYEFDESRVDSGSATLKCRKCQHMFRLGTDAQPSREDQQRWMVRDPSAGEILYFNSFDTLHRWIVEREVDRSWEISRTGDKWKTLGEVGEFRPIFQVVDNVSSLEAESSPQPGTTEKAPERNARSKKDTLDQFDSQGGGKSSGNDRSRTESDTQEQFPVGQRSSAGAEASAPQVVESQQTSGSGPASRPSPESTDPASPGADPDPSPQRPSNSQQSPPQSRSEAQPSADRSSGPHQSPAQTPAGGQSPETSDGDARQRQRSPSPAPTIEENDGGARQRQRSPSPAPTPDAADDPTERSDVQLDSDMFGRQSSQEAGAEQVPEADEDEWAFGDEDVGYDETTVREEESVDYYAEDRRRWPMVLGIAVVVAAGSAAYIWVYQRDLVDGWLASGKSSEAVDIAESSGEATSGGDGLEASRSQIAEGVSAAAEAAREKGIEQFEAARGKAADTRVGALTAAREKAKKKAKEKEKVSTDDLLSSAQRALERGRAKEARGKFHKVIDRQPQNSEAITGLGWALMNIGKTEAAIAQFEKALHHNPSYGDAYIGLGQAHQAVGNSRKALEAYQTYLDKLPGGSKSSIAEYQSKQLKKSLGIE